MSDYYADQVVELENVELPDVPTVEQLALKSETTSDHLKKVRKDQDMRIVDNVKVLRHLIDGGFEFELPSPDWCTIDIDKTQLPRLRKVLGLQLEKCSSYVRNSWSDTNNDIYVELRIVQLPDDWQHSNVKFRYVTELTEDSKCKIETHTSTSRTLVCNT